MQYPPSAKSRSSGKDVIYQKAIEQLFKISLYHPYEFKCHLKRAKSSLYFQSNGIIQNQVFPHYINIKMLNSGHICSQLFSSSDSDCNIADCMKDAHKILAKPEQQRLRYPTCTTHNTCIRLESTDS